MNKTNQHNELSNTVYFITGGSMGIGYAAAKALILKGANVAIASRGQKALDAAVDKLNQLDSAGKAMGFAADVSNQSAITDAINAAAAHFGQLDGIINNAGVTSFKKFEDYDIQEMNRLVNINFFGLIFASQAAIPHLKKSDNPRILNISSATVRHPDEMAYIGLYAATKAAVERLSIDMREELLMDNIGVTVFSPGGVLTEQASVADANDLEIAFEAWQRRHPNFNGYLEADTVGESIAQCFCFPRGAALDFIELRPNNIIDKKTFADLRVNGNQS